MANQCFSSTSPSFLHTIFGLTSQLWFDSWLLHAELAADIFASERMHRRRAEELSQELLQAADLRNQVLYIIEALRVQHFNVHAQSPSCGTLLSSASWLPLTFPFAVHRVGGHAQSDTGREGVATGSPPGQQSRQCTESAAHSSEVQTVRDCSHACGPNAAPGLPHAGLPPRAVPYTAQCSPVAAGRAAAAANGRCSFAPEFFPAPEIEHCRRCAAGRIQG